MNYNELKLWIINMTVISITFTQIENALKLVLLFVSIGYSLDKWIKLRNKKENET